MFFEFSKLALILTRLKSLKSYFVRWVNYIKRINLKILWYDENPETYKFLGKKPSYHMWEVYHTVCEEIQMFNENPEKNPETA